jgi:hypothetical protein
MTRTTDHSHRPWRNVATGLLFALAACGAGLDERGDSGTGGGPRGPGGTGNPLDVVLDFSVDNDAATERTETVRASVPFPEGGYQPADLANMVVSGHQTAWLPLQYWADGRVKIAQAQFTDVIAAGETKSYVVTRDEPALTGSFERNDWVVQRGGNLQFGAEVRDTFNVVYRSYATGPGEVLQSTSLCQTRRYRTYHYPVSSAGIGRDYLTSTFYVTEYRDMPFVVVDWLIGNDYLGADTVPAGNTDPNLQALGAADVRAAYFLCRGADEVRAYRPVQEGVNAPEAVTGGYSAFRVMQDTYIGDAQTRRYRFLARFEQSSADLADRQRWRDTANAMLEHPMPALATQRAWEETRAAGLMGGPIRGPIDSRMRAESEYQTWANTDHFGTWGTHGDLKGTAVTGTPRNAPLSEPLAHAIQGQHHRLLVKLEQMAWVQAVRPYHLWNLQVGAEQNIILWDGTPMLAVPGETLGRRRIADNDPYPAYRSLSQGQPRAHDYQHFDDEHWTTDLLFDYYMLSGDAWAREELRQLGQSLKGLMRLKVYYTAALMQARAEGWTMQGFVQVYQATQDQSLRQYAMRRVNEIVEPRRAKNHPSRAMTLFPNHPATQYPLNHEFYMPWQHGAVLWGYLAAYKYWGDPVLLAICDDVAHMVDYSWVTNVWSPTFGNVAQGLRYYAPATHNGAVVPPNYWDNLPAGPHFGDSPLGGAHTFLIGGLHYLAEVTNNNQARQLALLRGGMLLGTPSDGFRWNKWVYCLPPTYAP